VPPKSISPRTPLKNEDIKLVINNTEIEKVRSCKYLGIYIDDELNWHVHIDYIFNKLLKFTGIFVIYIIMLQELEAICTFLFLIAFLEREE